MDPITAVSLLGGMMETLSLAVSTAKLHRDAGVWLRIEAKGLQDCQSKTLREAQGLLRRTQEQCSQLRVSDTSLLAQMADIQEALSELALDVEGLLTPMPLSLEDIPRREPTITDRARESEGTLDAEWHISRSVLGAWIPHNAMVNKAQKPCHSSSATSAEVNDHCYRCQNPSSKSDLRHHFREHCDSTRTWSCPSEKRAGSTVALGDNPFSNMGILTWAYDRVGMLDGLRSHAAALNNHWHRSGSLAKTISAKVVILVALSQPLLMISHGMDRAWHRTGLHEASLDRYANSAMEVQRSIGPPSLQKSFNDPTWASLAFFTAYMLSALLLLVYRSLGQDSRRRSNISMISALGGVAAVCVLQGGFDGEVDTLGLLASMAPLGAATGLISNDIALSAEFCFGQVGAHLAEGSFEDPNSQSCMNLDKSSSWRGEISTTEC